MAAHEQLSPRQFPRMFGADANQLTAAANDPSRYSQAEEEYGGFESTARQAFSRASGLESGFNDPHTLRGRLNDLSRSLEQRQAYDEGQAAINMGLQAHSDVLDEGNRMLRAATEMGNRQEGALSEISPGGHPDSMISESQSLSGGAAPVRRRLVADLYKRSLN